MSDEKQRRSFREAKAALELAVKWADTMPHELMIDVGLEQREGRFVIVVSIPENSRRDVEPIRPKNFGAYEVQLETAKFKPSLHA